MDRWTPVVGQILLVKREPANPVDSNAVAVYLEDSVVGHIPFNLASYIFHFLSRESNKAFAEVIGGKVNRGAGYGLEIPCVYRLYGPRVYINKMKDLVQELIATGLV